MKTLRLSFSFLLFMIFAASCATRGPGPSRPGADPTMLTQTTTDRKGNVVETVTDNRGKAAAAEGQAMLTTEEVWKSLVSKLPSNESPQFGWTMTETAYSIYDMPNQVAIDQLKEKHKNILAEAGKLAEAGLTKDYDDALKAAAAIAGEIARRISEGRKEDQGAGDRGSILNRTISVGPDHTIVPLAQATEMGAAVRSRHGNQNTISHTKSVEREDTSTTEEILAAFDASVRIEELRLAFALASAEQDDKEVPSAPDEVKTPVVPSDDLPGHVQPAEVSTTGTQQFLWKPISDSNGNLVVIFPASFNGRISNVAVNGERGTFSSIANGNRTHWRFSKPGSAYQAPAKVTATVDGNPFSVTVDTPAKRTTLDDVKPPAQPIKASEMPKPPAPNGGAASAPGE